MAHLGSSSKPAVMKWGYPVAAGVSLLGLALLIISALFARIQVQALFLAGLCFCAAGLLVAADIGSAGTGFIGYYERWLHKWLPWIKSPRAYGLYLRLFAGGVAFLVGVVSVSMSIVVARR